MADETRVGAIIYTNDDVDSTALRCCLAHEDFTENPEACDENVVETFELMYLGDDQPDNMRCANITYSQTDKVAPGLVARVVTVIEGERTEVDREFVGDDVCCVELNQGCEPILDDIIDGDDQFEDGTCIPGENNPCETCDLSFYETTIYRFLFPIEPTTVVGDELMTEMGAPQERCCAAGIALGRDDLIQACLEDDGEEEMQLELNDQNECLERDVQPMRYADPDGFPISGYEPISTVLRTRVVDNDVCCSAGCDGPEFASLLGACASVTETPGEATYTPIKRDDLLSVF